VGAAKSAETYQFKVTLIGITPPIWRRVQVEGGRTLAQFHRVLQSAMGWENYHLYMFRIGNKAYGPRNPEDDGGWNPIDAKRMRLSAVLPSLDTTLTYVYDLGDNWGHELLLEAIVVRSSDLAYPRCIVGERSCPPEDAGGIGGYTAYLDAMADPNHEKHEEMMMWRGPFDPERFSVEKVNQELARRFRSKLKAGAPLAETVKPTPSVNPNRLTTTLIRRVIPQKQRIPVKPDETVPLELNRRERDLIICHTFADDSLTDRLRVTIPGRYPVLHFTLEDLDELVGFIAAEANHAKNRVLQEQLDQLCDRIESVLSKYTDADALANR
jgi:Plasmid pRiA4b ORF-3-like protein